MKKLITMMLLALFVSVCVKGAKVNEKCYLIVRGMSRSYWLYVPDNISANMPLVFSLHGTGGQCTDRTPFDTNVAEQNGCIAVYPQGQNIYFPVFGGTLPGWKAIGTTNEDIDFFKAIIEEVADKYSIDRNRIYCCGFSNGGMMTYTVANVASDIFAAFASISGYPINEFHLHHSGMRPVPFLHIHGKKDDFVKYAHMPVIVDNMVARNGCNPVGEHSRGNGYDKTIYHASNGGFPYIYYEIDNMGHNDHTINTEDRNSAITMWNFMSQYTLDSKCDTTIKWLPNIDSEGYKTVNHGFTINSGNTILSYGGEAYNTTNQNVYHSIQMENGLYKLCFHADGINKQITVKLKKINGDYLINKTVECGNNIVLPYAVTDGWGEYQLEILRQSVSDNIKISDLAIYSNYQDTGIKSACVVDNENEKYFSLSGVAVASPSHGIYIVKKGNSSYLIRR